jgi:hypothetical protein
MKQLDEEIFGGKLGIDEYIPANAPRAQKPWYARLSPVEKKMIHLARAFIARPHVIVFHKPFDDLEDEWALRILAMVEDLVRDDRGDKRKRTAFISTGTSHMRDIISKSATLELLIDGKKQSSSKASVEPPEEPQPEQQPAQHAGSCMPFFSMTPLLEKKGKILPAKKLLQDDKEDKGSTWKMTRAPDARQKPKEDTRNGRQGLPRLPTRSAPATPATLRSQSSLSLNIN